MELKPDCVRDVLLAVEASNPGEVSTLEKLQGKLPKYSRDDLWYTCLKLKEGELLGVDTLNMCSMEPQIGQEIYRIHELTMLGHEYLVKIREPRFWKKVLDAVKEYGPVSLQILLTIVDKLLAAS